MDEIPPTGPMVINGVTLPDTVLPMVNDIQAYVDSGNAAPALEFVSPVKGPALPQISVEVGSGLRSAEDGAQAYDDDVAKQARQLGLPGW
jgi:raffinose/stachyose/melibiose transport system substrate-binding protein